MIENNEMQTAIAKIQSSNLTAAIKDEFTIFEMFEKNLKFEQLANKTVQPLVIWFSEEQYLSNDTEQLEDGIKTYMLCEEGGNYDIYSGFSVTMRLKLQLLQNIFKNGLPQISIEKVSKGMKQEYSITPIRAAKKGV